MKKLTVFACLALALVLALSSFAEELPRMARGHFMVRGGNLNFEKAGGDTINLMSFTNDKTNDPAVNTCVFPWAAGEPYYDGDFEDDFGNPDWNGWTHQDLTGNVGDFAQLWTGLEDADPCCDNFTTQVIFIDDGVVVPGTGGTKGSKWQYGPGGYILNHSGGLAGPTEHLHNAIESPVMEWPGAKDCNPIDPDGIVLAFDVYRHEELAQDSPGMFYTWGVRSADTDAGEVITEQGWKDRNFVYYGGPDCIRGGDEVTDLMNSGRDEVQIQLTVYEIGWIWGFDQSEGTPAPYFDNVTVKIFSFAGPGISGREIDLAQDNFPERGSIDMSDPALLSVRFDMANNISPASHGGNDPGDTIVVNIVPVRAGAYLDRDPRLYYILDANPVFDLWRTANMPNEGFVTGYPAFLQGQPPSPDRWAFDLPDTGFLFPGDVLHYYFEAKDNVGGDIQTSLMPADTTGYSGGFGNPMGYNSSFVVRALPSIREDGLGGYEQPGVLFINDFGGRGGENEWYYALNNIGLQVEVDYDAYYVNGPSSGVGNGIGGRANTDQLAGYEDMLYTCGNLSMFTISNGDSKHDAGDDVGVLTEWLEMHGKDMFLTGDDLASNLNRGDAPSLNAFLWAKLGVSVVTDDVQQFINNQTSPLVMAVQGNEVFTGALTNWIAYGGCAPIHTIDGVNANIGATRLAEFVDPGGNVGSYLFSAASLNKIGTSEDDTTRVISLPYDLMYVYTDPTAPGNDLPNRARLLKDVLSYFGIEGDPGSVTSADVPGITFQTSNFPNPFNPSTMIKYSMPKTGHLKLSIYNVRGQLVKTLIDGVRPAGADQSIVWDGTNNHGSSVSSGIYFYEARTGGEVKVQKMALVK